MDILRQYMGPWPTWEQVPREKKEFLFGKFKEHFMWVPEHEADIRHSWEQTHKRNFKNTIYRFKQKAIKEIGVDDPSNIKKVVPKNMSSSDWEAICNGHMSDQAYKERCKKAKQNRLTEKNGSITKHTGGSIPFAEHARRMAKDGRDISQGELHQRTHRKDKGKGEYVDNKSKRVYEQYEQYEHEHEHLSQNESNLTPESSFDAKKWLEIVGGPSKGRVYSFGSTYHYRQLISSGTSPESTFTAAISTYVRPEQLQEALSKAKEEFVKEKEEAQKARDEAKKLAEVIREKEEVIREKEEAIQRTYEAMLAKFGGVEGPSSQNSRASEGDKNT